MSHERPSKLETYRDREVAATYDRRWAGARGQKRDARKAKALRRAVASVRKATGAAPKTLLDIPCGTGRFTDLWRDQDLTVLSADLALPMLAEAHGKFPHDSFLAADLAKLPFADDGLDLAICIRFLHLVRAPELRITFLKELRRVCKVGAVIDYRHAHTFRVWSRRLRYRLGRRERPPANPSYKQIRHEIAEAGWSIVDWIDVHPAPGLSDKLLLAVVPSE
ncbi:MAG: class I SAM-dependent methyltransferase [Planctomycetota bacterium]